MIITEDTIEVSKLLKGIVICRQTGVYLLDLIIDSEINPILLSSFVGALGMFGSENMGKIEEIVIKGLDIQMIIVNKYDLFLIAILDKNVVREDIHAEAEKALDLFYAVYKDAIGDSVDLGIFEPFKKALYAQIEEFFNKITENSEIGDFGFFTQAITKLRNETH
ncbi:MAG: hypothetical protein KGD61_00910 [Candidatus Lokiarchaeota archaeon]|nr:hypothetical protein [Candidatus Lokiarchaeota archaeon]